MGMIQDIRARHPEYDDMSDDVLADALYSKFYSDMPKERFLERIRSAPDVGGLESFGRGALQGATLGGGDEIYAAFKAARSRPNRGGRTPSTPQEQQEIERVYDDTLSGVRRANAAAQEANPTTYLGGQFVGGIATAPILPVARGATAATDIGAGILTGGGYGGVAGFASGEGGFENRLSEGAKGTAFGGVLGGGLTAGFRGAKAIRRAYANQGEAGAYGTIADDLPNGVDQFADEVAAGASRANINTNRRTLDILGEEMQRANGNVQQAQQATIARIVQEANVTPDTAAKHIRRLTDVHQDSPLVLAEYPSVSGSDAAQRLRQPGNVDLDELGRMQDSTTQGTLDYLANNGNAQSAINVRNSLSSRQETLSPAMRESLQGIGPQVQTGLRTHRPANIVDTADMVENARQLGHQEYQTAYEAPINNNLSLHVLPRLLQRYQHEAGGRAGEAADAMRRAADQFYITTPNGQRLAMNTLQQLQDARGALRGQMTAYARGGRDDLARVVQPMYHRITRLMEAMSPQWAVANRRWAGMHFDEVAQDLGDAFAERAGPRFREQVAEFQGMAPQAQNIVRVHVLQKLFDKLDNLPDTHSVSKLFANDQSRTLIRTLFGDDAVVSFTRAVRDQRVAEASRSMTQNSATHRRSVAQRQKDADTGLVAAVEGANSRGVRNWLLDRATQVLTERRNRPMADILTTPMSDTASVARHIHNMRQQQNRLQQIDRPSSIQGPATVSAASSGAQAIADRREPTSADVDWPYPPPMRLGGPKPTDEKPRVPFTGDKQRDDEIYAEFERARQQRIDDALLRYGDRILVPGLSELGSSALDSIGALGEASLAFGPGLEALDAPMRGMGALYKSMRARPPTAGPTGPVSEMEALSRKAAAGMAEKRAASAARDAAEAAKRGMSQTVPLTENTEKLVQFILDHPSGRSISGTRGMLSSDEQINLLRSGSPPPIKQGPWGENIPASVQDALNKIGQTRPAKTTKNVSSGPVADPAIKPGAEELSKAYLVMRNKVAELEEQVRASHGARSFDRNIKAWLRDDLDKARAALEALKKEMGYLPEIDPSKTRPPPSIYRRKGE